MAGGFTIDLKEIERFKDFVINKYQKSKAYNHIGNKILIDSIISSTALNNEFYEKLNQFSPFGPGNNEPKFLIEEVKIIKVFKVGDSHLKVVFISKNNKSFSGIAFNCIGTEMEQYLSMKNRKMINIVGKISLNEWKGKHNIEFIIEDISVIKTN